ncbi:hypothetical protein G1H11_15280 [Phytoactinopolyspora alkaliphila]|uniref:Uncharacterized protein n=1 Tax=Phytoactinopolyspora alkaliphila TaxID=1783498 RepID=A0A6N9YNM9_9ACTN|nr:hypothetical protein [Phytoactinopolyspora alkaliphila]NED96671.1 hypothetical protein [Phytoactinopolyspora alkaliphila]
MGDTHDASGYLDPDTAAEGLDSATVDAVGKLTEALETVEVARGHLYAFHQLTGSADFTLEEAVSKLRDAGHVGVAEQLSTELLGRNVLPGRWTYQVIEDYEDTYYHVFRALERQARELVRGHRHLHEAELKRRRRTAGLPGHEPHPGALSSADPNTERHA